MIFWSRQSVSSNQSCQIGSNQPIRNRDWPAVAKNASIIVIATLRNELEPINQFKANNQPINQSQIKRLRNQPRCIFAFDKLMTPACDPKHWKLWIINKNHKLWKSQDVKTMFAMFLNNENFVLSPRNKHFDFWDFRKSWFVGCWALFKRFYDHWKMLQIRKMLEVIDVDVWNMCFTLDLKCWHMLKW